MKKFLVYVDGAAPYTLAAASAMDATIFALESHKDAGRVEVKPAGRHAVHVETLDHPAVTVKLSDLPDISPMHSQKWSRLPRCKGACNQGRVPCTCRPKCMTLDELAQEMASCGR